MAAPYIEQERRSELEGKAYGLGFRFAQTIDELNFVITKVLLGYLERIGTSDASLNELMRALECAKQEFYRQVVVPYERRKRRENGDVYC